MANVSKINGFKPVKHVNGSPYNGQANVYFVPSTDSTALFVGDVVKLAADGNASGYQQVTAATAGTAGRFRARKTGSGAWSLYRIAS